MISYKIIVLRGTIPRKPTPGTQITTEARLINYVYAS